MLGFCVMTEGGQPLPGAACDEGRPQVRRSFLPARDWQIEDTWYVAGLKGSGSHHIALSNTAVPEGNFFDLASGMPCVPGPLYQALRQLLPVVHSAMSVGMAEGALNDLVTLANTGRQQLNAAVPIAHRCNGVGERAKERKLSSAASSKRPAGECVGRIIRKIG
jgi:hypothetical protein